MIKVEVFEPEGYEEPEAQLEEFLESVDKKFKIISVSPNDRDESGGILTYLVVLKLKD